VNSELKTFLVIVGAVLTAIAIIGLGDEYDIIGLKWLHEAVGG